ncbi:jg12116 [Pararge aegeria aegeria]|uniref:Jg12116 protein n=1 Tax=Pararge aegeria aegeria TaxID=348720 RepID=A0A8S4QJJ6_9NEOP|nr:jg12116 [Pararge aegeria aegeria]
MLMEPIYIQLVLALSWKLRMYGTKRFSSKSDDRMIWFRNMVASHGPHKKAPSHSAGDGDSYAMYLYVIKSEMWRFVEEPELPT